MQLLLAGEHAAGGNSGMAERTFGDWVNPLAAALSGDRHILMAFDDSAGFRIS
jgi:hypothetical protein